MTDDALVFGASGLLGRAICQRLEGGRTRVHRASHRPVEEAGWLSTATPSWTDGLAGAPFTRVIWAHGLNAAGRVDGEGPEQLRSLLDVNVTYIADTLRDLLHSGGVAAGSRLVVVSSIWQETSRPDKFAYSVSKAALAGLVRSVVADLGPDGIAMNAVLPGPVDGPMTRAFLTPESVATLEAETPERRLVTADDVAGVCEWLSSPRSAGVNGQFIAVDGGWTAVRHV